MTRWPGSFFSAQRIYRTERSALTLGILLGVAYVTAIVVLNLHPPYVDERSHFAQESMFFHGEWRLLPELSTIPGYHALLAMIMRALGTNTLDVVRVVHALLCLFAVGGFFALRRRLWPGTENVATAQFLCLPFMATLFFIVYTDVPAIALLLWAVWAAVSGRTIVSALLLSLLILVRQHECLWALLCMAIVARPSDGWPALRNEWRTKLIAALPFAAPILIFLIFWRVNGAVAISSGAASIHPDMGFHTGNVFTGVLMIGLLLPLQVIRNFIDFVRQGFSKWWWLPIPFLAFAAFWFGFRADHPFNGALAYYLEHFMPTRLTAAIVIAMTACFIWRVRLRPAGSGPALTAVTAIFLTASWMIEPRYILGPICLWLAMREHDKTWIEYATFVIWLVLSALMIWLLIATGFNV